MKTLNKYRMCTSKARYRSIYDAEKYMKKCESERGQKLRVYECPLCNGWHITKKEFKKNERI